MKFYNHFKKVWKFNTHTYTHTKHILYVANFAILEAKTL